MYKKAQNISVGMIITLVLSVIIVTTVGYNIISPAYNAQENSETLENSAVENDTVTLEYTGDNLVSGSLSIAGLTSPGNYSVNYTTGVVTWTNTTTPDNYTGTYDYYASTYVEDATNRTLASMVFIAMLIGLLALAFDMAT